MAIQHQGMSRLTRVSKDLADLRHECMSQDSRDGMAMIDRMVELTNILIELVSVTEGKLADLQAALDDRTDHLA